MEVDLRSGESEKRTLHWFVNGVTQKVYFKRLPSNVQFGVCLRFIVLLSFFFTSFFHFRLVGVIVREVVQQWLNSYTLTR